MVQNNATLDSDRFRQTACTLSISFFAFDAGTTSWRHSLKMELLPGPTTTPGVWHTTSISVGEGVLQLTVDGYPMLPMEHVRLSLQSLEQRGQVPAVIVRADRAC